MKFLRNLTFSSYRTFSSHGPPNTQMSSFRQPRHLKKTVLSPIQNAAFSVCIKHFLNSANRKRIGGSSRKSPIALVQAGTTATQVKFLQKWRVCLHCSQKPITRTWKVGTASFGAALKEKAPHSFMPMALISRTKKRVLHCPIG